MQIKKSSCKLNKRMQIKKVRVNKKVDANKKVDGD